MDAYTSMYEEKRGHAAGSSDTEKQASQLASDVRYKAKGKVKPGASEEEKKKIFLQILQASPAPNAVKSMAKQKLLGEENISEEGYDRMRDDKLVKYGTGYDGSDRKGSSNYISKPDTPEQKKRRQAASDKAYNSVVASLKKKYGDGVMVRSKKIRGGKEVK